MQGGFVTLLLSNLQQVTLDRGDYSKVVDESFAFVWELSLGELAQVQFVSSSDDMRAAVAPQFTNKLD